MAGNASVDFVLNDFPNGIDTTKNAMILEGTLLPRVDADGVIQITSWSIATNVVTFNCVNALTAAQVVNVSGFTGAYTFLNGTFTVTAATAAHFTASLTHADGSGTQHGLAVIQPTYTTGGNTLNLKFRNTAGQIVPVMGISGTVKPRWIQVQTLSGSAYNYRVISNGSTMLLKILNGITELTDATAIPEDAIGFRAEFTKAL